MGADKLAVVAAEPVAAGGAYLAMVLDRLLALSSAGLGYLRGVARLTM